MRTELIFKDFKKTEATESFILDKVDDLLIPLLAETHGYNLKVFVGEDAHRNEVRKPHFECTMTLKIDGSDKIYKVTKKDEDFYAVIHEAALAIQKMLRKLHDIEADHKTKNNHFSAAM